MPDHLTIQLRGRESTSDHDVWRWCALAVLALSILVFSLNATMLNVALPTLAHELHANTSQLQWVISTYNLVAGPLLLVAGAVGDRIGYKQTLLVGLVFFLAASLVGAWATNIAVLIFVRAAMGLSSAVVMPMTLAIIPMLFEQPERMRAIGIWSSAMALGFPLGPFTGGYLLDHFGWSSIFWVNVLGIVVVLPAAIVFLPITARISTSARTDWLGMALAAAGIATLMYGIINWDYAPAGRSLGTVAVGTIVLVGFVVWESKDKNPLVKLELFKHSAFGCPLSLTFLLSFMVMGSLFVLPLYLQGVLGFRAIDTGIILSPVGLMLVLLSVFASRLVARFGYKAVIVAGLTALSSGFILIATFTQHTSYGLIIASASLIGVGVGLVQSPTTSLALIAMPFKESGGSSALINAFRQVGGVFGVAFAGLLINGVYTGLLPARTQELPPRLAISIHASVANVKQVADMIGGPAGAELRVGAYNAFVNAMDVAALACLGVAIITAIMATLFLPARRG